MSKTNQSTMRLIFLSLLLFSCNIPEIERNNPLNSRNSLQAYYNYHVKQTNQLPYPENLLELTIKNEYNYGLIIKTPIMLIVDMDNNDTTYYDEIFRSTHLDSIPSESAYEDSIRDRIKNRLFFDLEKYILDSVSSRIIDFDPLKYNELYGYSFIHPLRNSVYLFNLTHFLREKKGRFKIFPTYDTIRYNYQFPIVPQEFRGYKKMSDNIKFDTFFLQTDRITQ